jgi:signal transduction histidine kinase
MVRIETENSEGMTRIAVQDNGPGIPPKERKRIFSPFYRIQNSLTEGVTGTGIGLAIARDLARLHGGDLILEDSERGARFLAVLATPEAPEGGEP